MHTRRRNICPPTPRFPGGQENFQFSKVDSVPYQSFFYSFLVYRFVVTSLCHANTTQILQTSRDSSPLRSALKKSSHNYYHQSSDPVAPPPRRYYSTESLQLPKTSSYQRYSEEEDEEIEETYSSMRRHRQEIPRHVDEFHTVGSYGVMPQRSRSQQPARLPRYDSVPDDVDEVSGVSHRFYDRSGNHVRAPRERIHDIQIQRDYGDRAPSRDLDFVRNTYKWEEQLEDTKVTTTTKIYEKVAYWFSVKHF